MSTVAIYEMQQYTVHPSCMTLLRHSPRLASMQSVYAHVLEHNTNTGQRTLALVFYLIESLHPPLSPVLQPVGQPLLPLLNLLLAEGLSESTITIRLLMDSCHQLTHGTTNITKTHQRRHLKEVSGRGRGGEAPLSCSLW